MGLSAYLRFWKPSQTHRTKEAMSLESPTLAEFTRHAKLFGSECVYETAEMYLGKKELRRLRIELDETEANKRGRYGTIIGKRRRRSADETRDAVLALSEEGFVRGVISEKLGVSESVVRRY